MSWRNRSVSGGWADLEKVLHSGAPELRPISSKTCLLGSLCFFTKFNVGMVIGIISSLLVRPQMLISATLPA